MPVEKPRGRLLVSDALPRHHSGVAAACRPSPSRVCSLVCPLPWGECSCPKPPREHRCCSWAAPRPSAFWGLGGRSGEGGASLKKKSRTPQPRHSRVIKTKRQPVRSPGRRWLVCLFSASPREGRALKCYRSSLRGAGPLWGPVTLAAPSTTSRCHQGPGLCGAVGASSCSPWPQPRCFWRGQPELPASARSPGAASSSKPLFGFATVSLLVYDTHG